MLCSVTKGSVKHLQLWVNLWGPISHTAEHKMSWAGREKDRTQLVVKDPGCCLLQESWRQHKSFLLILSPGFLIPDPSEFSYLNLLRLPKIPGMAWAAPGAWNAVPASQCPACSSSPTDSITAFTSTNWANCHCRVKKMLLIKTQHFFTKPSHVRLCLCSCVRAQALRGGFGCISAVESCCARAQAPSWLWSSPPLQGASRDHFLWAQPSSSLLFFSSAAFPVGLVSASRDTEKLVHPLSFCCMASAVIW